MYFQPQAIEDYIRRVNEMNILHDELERVQSTLQRLNMFPYEDKQFQFNMVCRANQVFRALLTEKTRQETFQEMSNNHSSTTENSGTSPTDNTRRGKGIWNILKKKVSW